MSTAQRKPDSENVSGHGGQNEGKNTQHKENVESCQITARDGGKTEGKNTQCGENISGRGCKNEEKNTQRKENVESCQISARDDCKHEGKNTQHGENVSGYSGKQEGKNTQRKENVESCQNSARDGYKNDGKNTQHGENVAGHGCKHEGKNAKHGANVESCQNSTSAQQKLTSFISECGNMYCAECGFQDPKWVSVSFGAFICIRCSGAHRSLGVHISKVLSVNLDEWKHEEVDLVIKCGGNAMVNSKYEALVPDNCRKPNSDSSIEERLEFIRRKYEKKEFMDANKQICLLPSPSNLQRASTNVVGAVMEKKNSNIRRHSIGQAFRNSWRRKDTENKAVAAIANTNASAAVTTANARTSTSMAGMVEFIGLIKVNVVKGTNLAVRDMITSDPYVILSLGNQSVKTRVIKSNLNPVWNEKLMLSIPDSIPPLKVIVYDRDTFKADDFMGDAEIDIKPLVSAAKASEKSNLDLPSMQLEKWVTNKDNTLVKDGVITVAKGIVKQEISLKLQNVEKGVLEIELECVPLTQ
ncbi:C2 domain, Arf GTPase activating protein [Artemisia annua]|uniref:C2 domain, Arf GTPase activating protein n=1 Tax=Artemisia annua TaxID=35608 RepID=A0A2U1KM99_ARTAN|nr:C2 domain, Arf GTPase activating protein [Artemisia annua]